MNLTPAERKVFLQKLAAQKTYGSQGGEIADRIAREKGFEACSEIPIRDFLELVGQEIPPSRIYTVPTKK